MYEAKSNNSVWGIYGSSRRENKISSPDLKENQILVHKASKCKGSALEWIDEASVKMKLRVVVCEI